MDMEPGEWIEDMETEGHLDSPFSGIKDSAQPVLGYLDLFDFLLKISSLQPSAHTQQKHHSSTRNRVIVRFAE